MTTLESRYCFQSCRTDVFVVSVNTSGPQTGCDQIDRYDESRATAKRPTPRPSAQSSVKAGPKYHLALPPFVICLSNKPLIDCEPHGQSTHMRRPTPESARRRPRNRGPSFKSQAGPTQKRLQAHTKTPSRQMLESCSPHRSLYRCFRVIRAYCDSSSTRYSMPSAIIMASTISGSAA